MQLTLEELFGRTYLECSPPQIMPSGAFWERWRERTPHSFQQEDSAGPTRVWLMDPSAASRGDFSTPNISAWPNDANVCSLSDVLWAGPIPEKYFLSPRACAGILRRAEKRGKELPKQLRLALESVANS
jgi:hypothetical protein